jgi:hypothetical protein
MSEAFFESQIFAAATAKGRVAAVAMESSGSTRAHQ